MIDPRAPLSTNALVHVTAVVAVISEEFNVVGLTAPVKVALAVTFRFVVLTETNRS